MPTQNEALSETEEGNVKQRNLSCNEDQLVDTKGEITGSEQVSVLQIEEGGVDDNGMEKRANGDGVLNVYKRMKKKKVKVELPQGEGHITRKIPDEDHCSMEDKRKGDIKGKLNGRNSYNEVKTEVKHNHSQSPTFENHHRAEINGEDKNDLKSKIQSDDASSSMKHGLEDSQNREIGGISSRLRSGKPSKTQEDACKRGMGTKKKVGKRGRPPKTQKRKSSEETKNSYKEEKKRSRISHAANRSSDEDGKQSRSEAKKLLRDRIVELLLAAGWRVEYRPRNGSDYTDAVYVNPEGKTHWSVTLAYKVYKTHVENCGIKDQEKAVLLSDEDLCILARKSQKKRCDKGKKKIKWEEDCDADEKKSKKCRSRSKVSKSVTRKKREEEHSGKRCAPLARKSPKDADSMDDGYTLYEGKLTLLSWMIDSNIVPINGNICCMNDRKTRVLKEGIITKLGIKCDCCGEVFSNSEFEIHARGSVKKPFENLYLKDGTSILQRLLDAWNEQDESILKGFHYVDVTDEDPNDDRCRICGDGGNIICCDGCPSTFHQSCLDIKKFPSGSWFCFYCSCKFCGQVEAALSPSMICHLCGEKYHQACIEETGGISNDCSNFSFCGKTCLELFEGLQSFIGANQGLPEGYSWNFLRRFDLNSEVSRVEVSEKIVCNSKLALAFSVMDECFSPFVDHMSGVNLLHNIVYNYGSNFNRLNYSGFLTAILEKGDEIIAVASVRIRGNQLAEMPFIGTRYMYRRQGMCRRLMSGIESALGSLGVEKLVIPAVAELTETWITGFGFKPVDEIERKNVKNLNLMVFPGVKILEKSLRKHNHIDKVTFDGEELDENCRNAADIYSGTVYNEIGTEREQNGDVGDEESEEEGKKNECNHGSDKRGLNAISFEIPNLVNGKLLSF